MCSHVKVNGSHPRIRKWTWYVHHPTFPWNGVQSVYTLCSLCVRACDLVYGEDSELCFQKEGNVATSAREVVCGGNLMSICDLSVNVVMFGDAVLCCGIWKVILDVSLCLFSCPKNGIFMKLFSLFYSKKGIFAFKEIAWLKLLLPVPSDFNSLCRR